MSDEEGRHRGAKATPEAIRRGRQLALALYAGACRLSGECTERHRSRGIGDESLEGQQSYSSGSYWHQEGEVVDQWLCHHGRRGRGSALRRGMGIRLAHDAGGDQLADENRGRNGTVSDRTIRSLMLVLSTGE